MTKEEKDLIQCDLVLTYIKNKDYSTYYRRKADGMVIDNDILKNEDNLYITTLKKYNDLQQENKQLKEQLYYLRSGEYYNQLRFENEMLQQVVDTNGVPSEVYDYIDCTHRNTELLEQIKELKKQLEELKSTNKVLSEELTKDKILEQDCLTTCCGIPIGDIPKLINQQKEFIEYLENEKDRLARECSQIYEDSLGKTKLVNEDIFSEVDAILSKYKEIIGDDK